MKKLLPLALVALALTSCSAISEGQITAKVHEPAHYYTTTTCHQVGKVTICTPHTYYDNEDWRFDLRKADQTGWVYVTHETFAAYEVGQYWKDPSA